MRLSNYITELSLASDTKIEFKQKDQFQWDAFIRFADSDEWFEIWTHEIGGTPYIPFDIRDDLKSDVLLGYEPIKKWEIFFSDSHGSIDTTPKGKKIALQLFAAIEKFTKDWIKAIKPNMIEFSSGPDEPSKYKLYQLLGKRIEKLGYKHYTVRKEQYLIRNDFLK